MERRNKQCSEATLATRRRGKKKERGLILGGHKKGRPTKYDPKYCEQAFKLCLLGAKDTELADFFNVPESTLNNWKLGHPEFLESLKEGKIQADANVGKRLYERAMGYEHDDIELKVVSRGNNEGSEVVQVPIRKYYPPDVTACIFWLKNRQKGKWRDVQTHDVGEDSAKQVLDYLAGRSLGLPSERRWEKLGR